MEAKKPKRVWQPRPSPATRARILAAVQALLADPDAEGWNAGYGVHAAQIAAVPGMNLSLPTVYAYLAYLADAGALKRRFRGLYSLPDP